MIAKPKRMYLLQHNRNRAFRQLKKKKKTRQNFCAKKRAWSHTQAS